MRQRHLRPTRRTTYRRLQFDPNTVHHRDRVILCVCLPTKTSGWRSSKGCSESKRLASMTLTALAVSPGDVEAMSP